jgi:hypothetical protein
MVFVLVPTNAAIFTSLHQELRHKMQPQHVLAHDGTVLYVPFSVRTEEEEYHVGTCLDLTEMMLQLPGTKL